MVGIRNALRCLWLPCYSCDTGDQVSSFLYCGWEASILGEGLIKKRDDCALDNSRVRATNYSPCSRILPKVLALGQSRTELQVYCQVASGLAYQRGEGLPGSKKTGFISDYGHFSFCMLEFLYFVTEVLLIFWVMCLLLKWNKVNTERLQIKYLAL